MILLNDKVKLRAIKLSDEQLLREMINNPNIEENIIGWSYPVSVHNQTSWIQNLSNLK